MTNAELPPRKLSVDALNGDDPDLAAAVMRVKVGLNGVEQTACLAYDADAGTIERFVVDKSGKIVIDPLTHEVKREVVSGTVEVRWAENT